MLRYYKLCIRRNDYGKSNNTKRGGVSTANDVVFSRSNYSEKNTSTAPFKKQLSTREKFCLEIRDAL